MKRYFAKNVKPILKTALISYPKRVQCNICGWKGRRFLSDSWHKHIRCPKCRSDIRQRLLFAAFQYIKKLSFEKLISNKKILHFAPEHIVSSKIRERSAAYATADYLRDDCDFKLNMSNMPEINNESFDIIIACDVLEHVPDYQKALKEVNRILSSGGFGIFTVPLKDNLSVTYEDPTIVTPEDRRKHFGQWNHLRIFGEDFPKTIESKGFTVVAVTASMFAEDVSRRHVLLPPRMSKHPLATNYRKVFFCQKTL